MIINRRSFFRFVAGAAATPIVAKFAVARRMGAWAECKIVGGSITAVNITSAGSWYNWPPTITFTPPGPDGRGPQ